MYFLPGAIFVHCFCGPLPSFHIIIPSFLPPFPLLLATEVSRILRLSRIKQLEHRLKGPSVSSFSLANRTGSRRCRKFTFTSVFLIWTITIWRWAGDTFFQEDIVYIRDPLRQGHGNPLQYSCLENLIDRRAWQATVHGVARVGHDLATKPPRFKCKPRFIMYRVFYIYNRIFFTVADFTVLLLHFWRLKKLVTVWNWRVILFDGHVYV